MRFKRKLALIAISLFAVIAIAAFLAYRTRDRTRPDFFDTARIASYSNLLAIATRLAGDSGSTNIVSFLERNQSVFSDAERALRNPIEAPPSTYSAFTMSMDDLAKIKGCAKAFVARGEHAESLHHYGEAADSYVAAIELGVRFEHGPLINVLVGTAAERIGLRPLKAVAPKLSNTELVALAEKLQSINRDRIASAEIVRREQYFAAMNASNILQYARARFSPQVRRAIEKSVKVQRDLQTDLEGVSAAAAILAYSRENKTYPSTFQSLVPKYLKSTPNDPHCACPMHLLSTSGGAVAYSIGENKRDELGRGDDIVFSFVDALSLSK